MQIKQGMKLIDKIRKQKVADNGDAGKAKKPLVKMIDRYIIGKFLGTYIFSILLLLAIVVMFDINEKLDAMLTAPLEETIFDYFVNFLPYFANQFSPLFTFIAGNHHHDHTNHRAPCPKTMLFHNNPSFKSRSITIFAKIFII